MFRKNLLTVTLSAATLLTGLSVVRVEAQFVPPVDGQNAPRQGGRAGGRAQGQGNRPFGQFNGARPQNNPAGLLMSERMRRMTTNDPSHSAVNYLLTRTDVRSELVITTKQREALEELNKKAPQEMMEKFRNSEAIQQIQEKMREMRNLPESERQVQREKMRQEMRQRGEQLMTEFQTYQSELDKRAEAILTPAQIKRLYELDLQYRGGLALSEPKLGQEMELNPDQSQQVNKLIEEFRLKQREIVTEAMGFGNRNSENGKDSGAASDAQGNKTEKGNDPVTSGSTVNQQQTGGGKSTQGQPRNRQNNAQSNAQDGGFNPSDGQKLQSLMQNPQQMQARLDLAQGEIDKLRKAMGAKTLALLDQPQNDYWKKMLGKPFTFRVVD